MGWLKGLLAPPETTRIDMPWSPVPRWEDGKPQIQPANYYGYSKEGYGGNEVVFACVEMLATSAAEPDMRIKYGERYSKNHAVLRLLANPNPFQDRFSFWATVIMHRSIAGNAFAVKIRTNLGRVAELWLLRPDRVRIVPDADTFIRRYEYEVDGGVLPIAPQDMIHWRTRNPLDDYYGMPPLAVAAARIDVDNFMRDTMKTYMENRGLPAALLTVKQNLGETQIKYLQDRYAKLTGKLMVLHGSDGAQFSALNQSLGDAGLVIPDLNQISETRIAMVLGVDPGMIGTVIGASNSSYNNRDSMRESFWNERLKPLYQELTGPLNHRSRNPRVKSGGLIDDFPGVDEIQFDLSSVGALQAELDKAHERVRQNWAAGLISFDEARVALGLRPLTEGTVLLPSNMMATDVVDVINPPDPEPVALPQGVPNA